MDEKFKWISEGRLMAYVDDNAVLEPPCYNEIIYDIYYSYRHTGYSKNKDTPLEKLTTDFPDISIEDLNMLIEYFKQVDDYCSNVCCAFAGIYQSVGIPKSEEAQKDVQYVVKACMKRYPWLKEEYIEGLLPGICHMCNR